MKTSEVGWINFLKTYYKYTKLYLESYLTSDVNDAVYKSNAEIQIAPEIMRLS